LQSDSNSAKSSQFLLTYEGSLLIAFLGIFVPLCGFGWLAQAVAGQRSLPWEAAFLRSLPPSTTPGLDEIIGFVALSGGINVVVVLAVLGVLALKRLHRLRDALFVTLAVVGVVVLNLLARAAVQRTQLAWAGSTTPSFDFGFPSSQAADTFAVSFASALLLWPTRWRWMAVILGILYVLAVGLSRIYLGLHYPSDILAGWALSLACVTAASFVRRIPNKL
jgi:membrane-associated phospholipid phosphatase